MPGINWTQPLNNVIAEVLKRSQIRRMTEIGPGGNGWLENMALYVAGLGIELVLIDPIEPGARSYTVNGYKHVPISMTATTELAPSDIILARNVFSIGGMSGALECHFKQVAERFGAIALQAARCLSANPQATMILTEGHNDDNLVLDRFAFHNEFDVVLWEKNLTRQGLVTAPA